ncbi:MAG: nuclear transport factor 2 family protein [Selenomonadaceae bacterium]|nr:nuclear transport factor 2 family protein [Selenomonadaceae bacterium]
MTLEEMQAKMEIQELVGKFSNLEVDVPPQMALFTKDTHVKVFMGDTLAFDIHGVEELEKIFSQFTAAVKRSHHMNGQHVIKVDGDNASGILYCRAALVTEENGKEFISDNFIWYEDTYKKVDGKWLIAARTSHFIISDKHVLGA